jgi:hypothetical protein
MTVPRSSIEYEYECYRSFGELGQKKSQGKSLDFADEMN